MGQERMSSLSYLSTASDMLRKLLADVVTRDFAPKKSRNVYVQ